MQQESQPLHASRPSSSVTGGEKGNTASAVRSTQHYVSHNDVGLWIVDVMLPPPLTWAPGR